ncbi:MAG: hypothetical protein JNK94_09935 [Hyphomonadaceae bacterium]|nr:hypothetical protein [Hyphomonadaceae bacterium]
MRPGQRIETADDLGLLILDIARTDRVERTYNLTVSGPHTFLVGEDGAVVHNFCTKLGVRITGFVRHGINRAIGDGGRRAGVSTRAWRDALANPRSVTSGVDAAGRPFQVYTGHSARVVINPQTGQIASMNPLGRAGVRGP